MTASNRVEQDESNTPRCIMAIHPDPRFPLLPRDQADVIRIYIELKRAEDRSGREPEITSYQAEQPASFWIPGDLTDRE